MFTASYVQDQVEAMKVRNAPKADIIRTTAEMRLGWQYVYASQGQDCTPSWRRSRIPYCPSQKYVDMINGNCPVLSGKQPACDGCDFVDTDVFDCAGFVLNEMQLAGVPFYGQGATTQWNTASNWAAKGEISTMPRGLVCAVYKHKDGKMSHTGLSMGDGAGGVIHCSTTVKRGNAYTDNPKWTHWGIPRGLYTTDELRKAGIDVAADDNMPTLRRGSQGDEVADLQMLLNSKFGYELEVDGNFGKATESAVKDFQKKHGLTVDGVVGRKTWAALGVIPTEKPDTPQPNDRYRYTWDTLFAAIKNPYGVAGLMGNLQAESGLNPENLQNTGNRALGMTDAEYTAAVNSCDYSEEQFIHDGFGYGLAQWTYYSRKAKLLNYSLVDGCSIGSLDMQIGFMLAELKNDYKYVWDTLLTAKTVRDASDAVMLKYEKPANTSEENQIRRAELGQKFFDQFADMTSLPLGGEGGTPSGVTDEVTSLVTLPRLKLLEMQAALSDCLGIIKNALEGE